MSKIRERHPGAQLLPLVADLSTEDGFRTAIAAHPRVDILINNLGIYEVADFLNAPTTGGGRSSKQTFFLASAC